MGNKAACIKGVRGNSALEILPFHRQKGFDKPCLLYKPRYLGLQRMLTNLSSSLYRRRVMREKSVTVVAHGVSGRLPAHTPIGTM